MIDRGSVKRILIIKPRATGDVVLSTIVTRNLRAAFPDATIHFLTERASADLLHGHPYVDGLVVFDRRTMSALDLIRVVRRNAYDCVFDLFGNPRTALLTLMSGARYRVGYRFRGRSYAYNILATPRGGEVHNTQFNLDALIAAGIPVIDRRLHIRVPEEAARFAREYLQTAVPDARPIVAFATGGGWYTKRWGLDRYSELGDRIVESFGAAILLPWGPGERDDAERLRERMRNAPLIPPPSTLPQLAALLRECRAVVSNDSGPLHIAASVGTPVLGIYGPTNPRLQGPYGEGHRTVRREGLDCLGCNLTRCPIGLKCMLDLDVDTVFAAFEHLMRDTSRGVRTHEQE